MAVHFEIVLFGFATKDGMVFENEDAVVWPSLPEKKQRGRESANAATDDYAVVGLTCIMRSVRVQRLLSVAQAMPRAQNLPSVAIAVGVVAYAAVAAPI